MRVVAASGDWGRRNFARWMFEDEPRAVLLTPSRWHRGLLRRPGAYQPGATCRVSDDRLIVAGLVTPNRRWRPHVDIADR